LTALSRQVLKKIKMREQVSQALVDYEMPGGFS
jgi:hypothetical protein